MGKAVVAYGKRQDVCTLVYTCTEPVLNPPAPSTEEQLLALEVNLRRFIQEKSK